MFREWLPDAAKVRIRQILARIGVEVGAYTGSFAEHRTRLIRTERVATIWDVGAHIGQYATQLQSHGYVGQIISIEPSDVSFVALSKRAAKSATWTALSIAVSDSAGQALLHVAANGQSSSLLPMSERHQSASPSSRYVGSQPVKTTTLDELQDRLGAAPPFFIKLDLQGNEVAALRGAASVLRSTAGCEIELSLTELYEGGASWQDVATHLAAAGFVMCDIERVFFDPTSGDLLQLNALFRRTA
jgi:FkbM family methyltransferase